MTPHRAFGNEIIFFAPSLKSYETDEFQQRCDCSFGAVSITGAACELQCDHCRAVILRYMKETTSPDALYEHAAAMAYQGGKGILVSGGSDAGGTVPLLGFTRAISRIRDELDMKVIVHTGITSKGLANGLATAGVDCAMIDIIGSDSTIRRVCHLEEIGVSDYRRSLENLVDAGVPTAPHVVMGLDHGNIDGEAAAIEMIGEFDIASLVLVGLLPQRNTPMCDVEPPSPRQMGELFAHARSLMPDRPVMLGCERPGGDHKLLTDEIAIRAGLDGIAYPAEGTIRKAEELGMVPRRSEMCCALAMSDIDRQ